MIFKQNKITTLVAGFMVMLMMGSIFSWSTIRMPLEQYLSITQFQSGYPYLVFLAMYAFSMPIAGLCIDKIDSRKIAILGSVLLSMGYFLSSFADTIFLLTITYGFMGGTGVGILYGIPIALASRWFPDNKGKAIGFTLLGFGISPLLTSPLIATLIDHYSISTMFRVLGVSLFVVLVGLSTLMVFPKNQFNTENITIVNNTRYTQKQILIRLWFLLFIVAFSGLLTIGISNPFAQDSLGINNFKAAVIVSILAIGNGIGRLGFGFLVDAFGLKITMFLALILLFVASVMILVGNIHSYIGFIMPIFIVWLVFGGWLSITPISVYTLLGTSKSALHYGKVFTAYGLGAIIGVLLVSKIKIVTGSYQNVYVLVSGLSILGLVLVYRLFKKTETIDKPISDF